MLGNFSYCNPAKLFLGDDEESIFFPHDPGSVE